MAKKNIAANKNRVATNKGAGTSNNVEILDENPKEVPYSNPPGYKYVRASITDAHGESEESIICIGLDQLERIKKSK